MSLGKRIASLRNEKRISQAELAKRVSVSASTIGMWETDQRAIKDEDLLNLANFFEVSVDYLLGRTDKRNYYDLTEKDERDIANELEEMINDLSGNLLFSKDSTEVNDETRELLIASLENSLRIAKIDAKKRFTPKKYRD